MDNAMNPGIPARPGRETEWPHAPTHRLARSGTFVVTAGTYKKQHYFAQKPRLDVLQRGLLLVAMEHGWQLEAWAVFPNHYHFVGHSPDCEETAESLRRMLSLLHRRTAVWVNRLDRAAGRRVWCNYWETRLTYETSYKARLNYVHQNAVKHGLVAVANQYPWCSAGWFERTATRAQVRTIYRFPTNEVRMEDDFECNSRCGGEGGG